MALLPPFLTNGANFHSKHIRFNENDIKEDESRNLLSLTPKGEACYISTGDIMGNEGLEQLRDLFDSEDSSLWNVPLEQPFCYPSDMTILDGVVTCDARHLSNTIINFDNIKSACESDEIGGKFFEFDIMFNRFGLDDSIPPQFQIIAHVPLCVDTNVCMNGREEILLEVKTWERFGNLPKVSRSDGCDEIANKEFFIKMRNGQPQLMTCQELSQRTMANNFPRWISRNPCEKKWSPEGLPAPASAVCPVTCKQEICNEVPERVFLKDIVTSNTKTCKWLVQQNVAKQQKMCRRRYYRKEGFPSIPSAYSACPETCSNFDTLI